MAFCDILNLNTVVADLNMTNVNLTRWINIDEILFEFVRIILHHFQLFFILIHPFNAG